MMIAFDTKKEDLIRLLLDKFPNAFATNLKKNLAYLVKTFNVEVFDMFKDKLKLNQLVSN